MARCKPAGAKYVLGLQLIYLFVLFGSTWSTHLTFEVANKDRICFYEEFGKTPKAYEAYYKVIKGASLDIDVFVTSPRKKVLMKDKKRKHGTLEFTTEPGVYEFCFANTFSKLSHKTVYFELAPEDEQEEEEEIAGEEDGASPVFTVRTMMEASVQNMHKLSKKMRKTVARNKAHERAQSNSFQWLNRNVQRWAIAQTAAILVCGVGQIIVLRTFFRGKVNTVKSQPRC